VLYRHSSRVFGGRATCLAHHFNCFITSLWLANLINFISALWGGWLHQFWLGILIICHLHFLLGVLMRSGLVGVSHVVCFALIDRFHCILVIYSKEASKVRAQHWVFLGHGVTFFGLL
jgi:hypothetical protein